MGTYFQSLINIMADDSPQGIVQPDQETQVQPGETDSLTSQVENPKAEETAGEPTTASSKKVPFTELSPEEKLKEARKKIQSQGEEKNKVKKDYEEMARELATENPAAIEKIANKDYALAASLSEELYQRPLGQLLGELHAPAQAEPVKNWNDEVNQYLNADNGLRLKECKGDEELNRKIGKQFKLFKQLKEQTPEILEEMLETARLAHLGQGSGAKIAKNIIKEKEASAAASVSTGMSQGVPSSFAEVSIDEFTKLSSEKKKEYMKKSKEAHGEVKFTS